MIQLLHASLNLRIAWLSFFLSSFLATPHTNLVCIVFLYVCFSFTPSRSLFHTFDVFFNVKYSLGFQITWKNLLQLCTFFILFFFSCHHCAAFCSDAFHLVRIVYVRDIIIVNGCVFHCGNLRKLNGTLFKKNFQQPTKKE